MVYYRKYRPQKISQLDSTQVRDVLTSILSAKDIPHAFLFTGPKGLGKTSAARIVAKIVNCEKKGLEPCNKCSQCVSITNGTNLDILEIDAASNRGIDEIRELRDKIKLAPLSSNKKVYIIDEAHMLTREAFNALLKTLEEPPSHVIFILCTTEAEKLPETIVSRCFTVRFKRAGSEEIIRSLLRIIREEKIAIDKEAVSQIAALSDGSFRDGAKILEQLKSAAGRKKITPEFLVKVNITSNTVEYIHQLKDLLQKRKAKEALKVVAEIVKDGIEINLVIGRLIEELHRELIVQIIGEVKEDGFTPEELKNLINLLARAHQEGKFAVITQLPLELVIIEWGMSGRSAEVGNENFFVPQLSRDGSQSVNKGIDARQDANRKNLVTSPHSTILNELIEKIKPFNHSVAGVLRGCKVGSFDGKSLIIETNYKFHQERLEEVKTKQLLEEVAGEIIGSPVKVVIRNV